MNKLSKFIGVLSFVAATSVAAQTSMVLPIIEVHDGDTIKTSLTLPAPLDAVSVRILHIDTPEMPARSYATTKKLGRAQCVKEAELALKARDMVKSLAAGYSTMTVTKFGYGKYAGRIIGNVFINNVDIGQYLINHGVAVPYEGGTKTKDWCQ